MGNDCKHSRHPLIAIRIADAKIDKLFVIRNRGNCFLALCGPYIATRGQNSLLKSK